MSGNDKDRERSTKRNDRLAAARAKIAEGVIDLIETLVTEHQHASESLLTVKQAAEVLQCAEDTVRSAAHREIDPLPVCKVGSLLRFRRREILEWASGQRPQRGVPRPAEPARCITPVGVRRAQRRN